MISASHIPNIWDTTHQAYVLIWVRVLVNIPLSSEILCQMLPATYRLNVIIHTSSMFPSEHLYPPPHPSSTLNFHLFTLFTLLIYSFSSSMVVTTLDCRPKVPGSCPKWVTVGASILWRLMDCTGLTRPFICFGIVHWYQSSWTWRL